MIHYVIVRRDIHRTVRGSGIGALAAQVVHAAGVSAARYAAWMHEIIPADTIACVLGVPNERALKRLHLKLIAADVHVHPINEPDAPWNGQLMALGLWPVHMDDSARKLLARYKLL